MSQRACPFASKSVTEHLVRGIGAAGLIVLTFVLAYTPGAAATAGAIASGVGAVVLMRGCPTCWLTGLFFTLSARADASHTGRAPSPVSGSRPASVPAPR